MSFRLHHFLVLTLFVFSTSATVALAGGDISFSVESAAAYALKNNPSLAAARFRIIEARGHHEQSGRLSNPELEIDISKHTRGLEGSAGIAFTQRFPLTARLRHEKAASRAELTAAEAEVRDAERKLTADVRSSAVRLLAIRGQRNLRARQLTHTRDLASFLQKRVETGEASSIDATQVDLESRQVEIDELQLAADEAVLLGELRPLLGISTEAHITINGELPAPKTVSSRSGGVTGRPDVIAAESRAEAARSSVLEQRARRWEDFGFGASYSRERVLDVPEPVETEQVVGFRFSFPLPFWNNNSGRIHEAEAAAARAGEEVTAAKLGATSEIIAARNAMNAYARLISELDDKVLPAATHIEEQLRDSYSAGQTSLTDVLRSRTRRLELERQRLDALRDFHLARIRHEAATATTPRARNSSEK